MARGASTFYAGKIQKPVTVNLTAEGHRILGAIYERAARSRSDIFEHLLRSYGEQLTFDVPVLGPKKHRRKVA